MCHLLRGIIVVLILAAFCPGGQPSWGGEVQINGAGATFPEPFYFKAFDSYYRQRGIRVNYRGEGSGAGMRQLFARRVDFAGTDIVPNEPGPDKTAGNGALVRIPTCLGAVVLVYNLRDNPKLRFTPEIIADIYLGKIVKWNDPRLLAINRDISLPDLAINVIHRSDESGTTYIFTDYLSKTSNVWQRTLGPAKSHVQWPTGQGARGNPGLAGMVRQITGAIGYVELTYAVGNDMTFGLVQNKSGKFIEPSPATVANAANITGRVDNGVSLTDTTHPDGYPISGFTWLVIFKEQNYGQRDKGTVEELIRMLWWVTHDGQKYAPALRYVPLPKGVVKKTEGILKSVTYNGVPLAREKR
jgi:phosphate transport system substrate-binding protein